MEDDSTLYDGGSALCGRVRSDLCVSNCSDLSGAPLRRVCLCRDATEYCIFGYSTSIALGLVSEGDGMCFVWESGIHLYVRGK